MFRLNLLLISTAAIVTAQTTISPASGSREYYFAPVGLGSAETASITVLNTAAPATAGMPSCSGTIAFSNASGDIGTPTAFTLGSKQMATLALPFAKAGLSGVRGEILGRVSLTLSSSRCSPLLTLEIYDTALGTTHAVLTNPSIGPPGSLPIVVIDPRPHGGQR